jgi:hypothetical protein
MDTAPGSVHQGSGGTPSHGEGVLAAPEPVQAAPVPRAAVAFQAEAGADRVSGLSLNVRAEASSTPWGACRR